jgi:predicted dinucleotide-binding enzyme
MKIGIIGAGNIGGNLTRRLSSLGHDVSVANSRGPETLHDLQAETGARAVPVTEAANGAEIVIVTVPEKAVPSLPDGLFDGAANNAVVIDTGNYYPQRDGRIAAIEDGQPESAWVAEQLGRPVVKVFNNILAHQLIDGALPSGTPGRVALPVAGDDQRAKEKVM